MKKAEDPIENQVLAYNAQILHQVKDLVKSTSASAVDVKSAVEMIIEELHRMKKGVLATSFEEAKYAFLEGGTLVVTFERASVFSRKLEESASIVKDLGVRLFKRPIELSVIIEKPSNQEEQLYT